MRLSDIDFSKVVLTDTVMENLTYGDLKEIKEKYPEYKIGIKPLTNTEHDNIMATVAILPKGELQEKSVKITDHLDKVLVCQAIEIMDKGIKMGAIK